MNKVRNYWDQNALRLIGESSEAHPFVMNKDDLNIFKQFNKPEYKNILVLGATPAFMDYAEPHQHIWFIDASPRMLDRIDFKHPSDNTHAMYLEWQRLPSLFKIKFDLVLACGSFNCFGKAQNNLELFKLIDQILKPGGILVSRYFDKLSLLQLKDEFKYSTLFKTTPTEQVDYEMSEDVYHNFSDLWDYLQTGQTIFPRVTTHHYCGSKFPIVKFSHV